MPSRLVLSSSCANWTLPTDQAGLCSWVSVLSLILSSRSKSLFIWGVISGRRWLVHSSFYSLSICEKIIASNSIPRRWKNHCYSNRRACLWGLEGEESALLTLKIKIWVVMAESTERPSIRNGSDWASGCSAWCLFKCQGRSLQVRHHTLGYIPGHSLLPHVPWIQKSEGGRRLPPVSARLQFYCWEKVSIWRRNNTGWC